MRHLLNILDLTTKEINELITTALDIEENPEKYSEGQYLFVYISFRA